MFGGGSKGLVLVRFKSDVGGFTMFGDVAVKLLRMCGHSGTVPSAIPAAEVPAALERLEAALAEHPEPPPPVRNDPDREPAVTLRNRAYPLLELLREAAREECGLMWERG